MSTNKASKASKGPQSAPSGGKGNKIPYSGVVMSVPLENALAEATALWTKEEWYPPAACRQALGRLNELVAAAKQENVDTVGALLHGAEALLIRLHGPRALATLPNALAEPVHLDRNLLLAMNMTATVHRGSDPRRMAREFPRLHIRTEYTARPSTDDEIALCRIVRWFGSNNGPEDASVAAGYVLLESGLAPSEVVQVDDDDVTVLGDLSQPVALHASGKLSGNTVTVRSRTITLDTYGRLALARAMPHRKAEQRARKMIGYGGKATGDAAAAGVKGNQNKLHGLLGIGEDLTASSPAFWRYRSTHDLLGADAALSCSGLTSVDALLRKVGGNKLVPAKLPAITRFTLPAPKPSPVPPPAAAAG